MIDKKKLLSEAEESFNELKDELDFKTSYEELDREFSIRDSVLVTGFVSTEFSKQICSRIVDFYRDWHGYLNNLLLPNPSFYAGQTESKLFNSEDDRKRIWNLITLSMKFSSMHSLNVLNGEKSIQAKFIDEGYNSWINVFKPGLMYILTKVSEGWKKE
ncbi:MAG: hypothetical protein NUV46_04845 [Nanoarchaeota archaeon]|nr:hypothetical protein [Nanoarchaeota archaeon]